jgi:hypothetical protein
MACATALCIGSIGSVRALAMPANAALAIDAERVADSMEAISPLT